MNRNKILPSERISNELSELFLNGKDTGEDLLGVILKKSLQKTIQEMLEQEIEKKLNRGYYERRSEGDTSEVYRNGYETRKFKRNLFLFSLCRWRPDRYKAYGSFEIAFINFRN